MRRLPYELYGASALMALAIALLVRAWQRERLLAKRVSSRISGTIRHKTA